MCTKHAHSEPHHYLTASLKQRTSWRAQKAINTLCSLSCNFLGLDLHQGSSGWHLQHQTRVSISIINAPLQRLLCTQTHIQIFHAGEGVYYCCLKKGYYFHLCYSKLYSGFFTEKYQQIQFSRRKRKMPDTKFRIPGSSGNVEGWGKRTAVPTLDSENLTKSYRWVS